jgi:hypothetical protein
MALSKVDGTNFVDPTLPVASGGTGITSGFVNGLDGWSSSSGNILSADASKGIYLGTSSIDSDKLLDDYEEGTWTPSVDSTSGFTNTNVDAAYSTYTKIGNLVNIRTHLQFPDSSGNVALGDYAYIRGLPFVPAAQDNTMMNAYRYNNGNNASAFVTTSVTTNEVRWVCNYVYGSPVRNGGRASVNFFYWV